MGSVQSRASSVGMVVGMGEQYIREQTTIPGQITTMTALGTSAVVTVGEGTASVVGTTSAVGMAGR
jgi:hypothetical protein